MIRFNDFILFLTFALAVTFNTWIVPASAQLRIEFTMSDELTNVLTSTLKREDITTLIGERMNHLGDADEGYVREHFETFYSQIQINVIEDGKTGDEPFKLNHLPLYYWPFFRRQPTFHDTAENNDVRVKLPPEITTLQMILSLWTEKMAAAEKNEFFRLPELKGDLLHRVNHSPLIIQNGPLNLGYAVHSGNLEAMRFLFATAARDKILSAASSEGINILHYALQIGDLAQIELIARSQPSLMHQKTRAGITPLMVAIAEEKDDAAIMLLELNQGTPKAPSLAKAMANDRCSAIDRAASQGRIKILEKMNAVEPTLFHSLLKLKPKESKNPLHFATIKAQTEVIEFLLAQAPELADSTDELAKLPILYSIEMNDESGLRAFHRAGFPIQKIRLRNQNTLLHFAAYSESPAAIQFLLELGSDPFLKNAQGKYPKDVAPPEMRKLFPNPATKPQKLIPAELSQPAGASTPTLASSRADSAPAQEIALQIKVNPRALPLANQPAPAQLAPFTAPPGIAEKAPAGLAAAPKNALAGTGPISPEQLNLGLLTYWSRLNSDQRAEAYTKLTPLLHEVWEKYRFETHQDEAYATALRTLLEERSIEVRETIGTLRAASQTVADHLITAFILASQDRDPTLEALRSKLRKILARMHS